MELFSDRPGDEGLPGHQRRLAMAATMTATTMAVFDGSMVNVALPGIARSLGVSSGAAIWVANGYLLAAAMTLAIFAALAMRMGFRSLFAFGLAVFTLASLGCALSASLPMLVAMRLLQGVGGAATLSIAPAILRSVFPNRLLGRILGLNALLIAACTAVAPVLGGALLAALGWQALFAINLPLGAVALVLALRVLPGRDALAQGSFDVAGAVLSAATLGALIMAADSFSHAGRGVHVPAAAIGYAAVCVCAGAAFVWRQHHAVQPLLPLDMFANPRFSLAALTSLASFVGQGITFVALPFLFQSVYGYDALMSALLFTPWPIGIVLVAPHAGRYADRYPPALISTAGLCVFALGLALLALLPDHAAVWDIGLRSLVCGLGFGCFQSPNNRELLGNASRARSGYASGMLSIVRTCGQSLGAALVGVVLSAFARAGVWGEEHAVRTSLWIAVGATVLAVVVSVTRLRHARTREA